MTEYLLGLNVFIILFVTIVEIHTLFNHIQKLLNFAIPFHVFINPRRIRECWLSKFLVSLDGLVYHLVNFIQLFYLLHFHA